MTHLFLTTFFPFKVNKAQLSSPLFHSKKFWANWQPDLIHSSLSKLTMLPSLYLKGNAALTFAGLP